VLSFLRGLAAFAVILAAGALLGSALAQWRPGAGPGASGTPLDPMWNGGRVRVEVLNAGGRPDMARRATELLRSRGFDVVYFGNADHFGQDSTTVLDRVGRPDAARAVARALGGAAVETRTDRNLYLDVTVRLGSDWEPGRAEAGPASGSPGDSTPWWDLPARIRR